jgi:hypothetical protein
LVLENSQRQSLVLYEKGPELRLRRGRRDDQILGDLRGGQAAIQFELDEDRALNCTTAMVMVYLNPVTWDPVILNDRLHFESVEAAAQFRARLDKMSFS